MKYSIVIPTYNHCDDLLKPCIESIIKNTDLTDIEIIVVANGCTDNTRQYVESLGINIKLIWFYDPIGYTKATNIGIQQARGEYVLLLNNDVQILDYWEKNKWLEILTEPFLSDDKMAITGAIKYHEYEIQKDFLIFFCVLIKNSIFKQIGLLDEIFSPGYGEDIDYCLRVEQHGLKWKCIDKTTLINGIHVGYFPIYHKGTATFSGISEYSEVVARNKMTLAKRYNYEHYLYSLSNNYERAVFLKGDHVFPRETTRYQWASKNVLGNKVMELGCSTGYGSQFLPAGIEYTGLDYDKNIINIAKIQNWIPNAKFIYADINTYELDYYDTIIAFEVIEHLDNGLEIVEKLKKHCDRLLVSVPYKETPGFWGEHHKLHMLDESHLPGFTYQYIDKDGNINDTPADPLMNLMLCKYDKK